MIICLLYPLTDDWSYVILCLTKKNIALANLQSFGKLELSYLSADFLILSTCSTISS